VKFRENNEETQERNFSSPERNPQGKETHAGPSGVKAIGLSKRPKSRPFYEDGQALFFTIEQARASENLFFSWHTFSKFPKKCIVMDN
jgi:hypothetical protein